MLPIAEMIGSFAAGAFVKRRINETIALDSLPEPVARRLVCERIADGDPLLLAAPGQTWVLRLDVRPDDAPAQAVYITSRSTEDPTVVVTVLDPGYEGTPFEVLPIEVLDLFELHAWQADPFSVLFEGQQ